MLLTWLVLPWLLLTSVQAFPVCPARQKLASSLISTTYVSPAVGEMVWSYPNHQYIGIEQGDYVNIAWTGNVGNVYAQGWVDGVCSTSVTVNVVTVHAIPGTPYVPWIITNTSAYLTQSTDMAAPVIGEEQQWTVADATDFSVGMYVQLAYSVSTYVQGYVTSVDQVNDAVTVTITVGMNITSTPVGPWSITVAALPVAYSTSLSSSSSSSSSSSTSSFPPPSSSSTDSSTSSSSSKPSSSSSSSAVSSSTSSPSTSISSSSSSSSSPMSSSTSNPSLSSSSSSVSPSSTAAPVSSSTSVSSSSSTSNPSSISSSISSSSPSAAASLCSCSNCIGVIVCASSYGLSTTSNSVVNSAAIQTTLNAALLYPSSTLVFPSSQSFNVTTSANILVSLSPGQSLVVEGSNSSLLCTDDGFLQPWGTLITIYGQSAMHTGQSLIVRNLTYTPLYPSWAQGYYQSHPTPTTWTFLSSGTAPDPVNTSIPITYATQFNPSLTNYVSVTNVNNCPNSTLTSIGGVHTLTIGSTACSLPTMNVGAPVALNFNGRYPSLFFIDGVDNVVWSHVVVHATASSYTSGNNTLDHVTFDRRPGWWLTTTTSFNCVTYPLGNVVVNNSVFRWALDDTLDVVSPFSIIYSPLGVSTSPVVTSNATFITLWVYLRLESPTTQYYLRSSSGAYVPQGATSPFTYNLVYINATVVSGAATWLGSNTYRQVVLQSSVGGIAALPIGSQLNTYVMEPLLLNTLTVLNSNFGPSAGVAIYPDFVQGSLIQNNTFWNHNSGSVSTAAALSGEGPQSINLVIVNNTFQRDYDSWGGFSPSPEINLVTTSTTGSSTISPAGGNMNATIANNTFIWNSPVATSIIALGGSLNDAITGNAFIVNTTNTLTYAVSLASSNQIKECNDTFVGGGQAIHVYASPDSTGNTLCGYVPYTSYSSSYNSVVLQDSPSIFIPLTESTPTIAVDLSGNANNFNYVATNGSFVTNFTSLLRTSSPSVYLPGGNASCLISSAKSFPVVWNNITFELWFATNTTLGGIIFSNNNFGSTITTYYASNIIYMTNNGRIYYNFDDFNVANYYLYSSVPYNDGLLHHVVVNNNGSMIFLYIDNMLISSLAVQANAVQGLTYIIGGGKTDGLPNPPTNSYFSGVIGYVAIFPNMMLNSTRVGVHYNTSVQNYVCGQFGLATPSCVGCAATNATSWTCSSCLTGYSLNGASKCAPSSSSSSSSTPQQSSSSSSSTGPAASSVTMPSSSSSSSLSSSSSSSSLLASPGVLSTSAFGVSCSSQDNSPAMQAAVTYALLNSIAVVRLPIACTLNASLPFFSATLGTNQSLSLDGQASTVKFVNNGTVLTDYDINMVTLQASINQNTSVSMQNATFDMWYPPFAQGTYNSTPAANTYLFNPTGSDPLALFTSVKALYTFDVSATTLTQLLSVSGGVLQVVGGLYQLTTTSSISSLVVGNPVALLSQKAITSGSAGISVYGVDSVSHQAVTVYTSPGIGVLHNLCGNIVGNNVRVGRRSDRLLASMSDTFPVEMLRGNATITNSVFGWGVDDIMSFSHDSFIANVTSAVISSNSSSITFYADLFLAISANTPTLNSFYARSSGGAYVLDSSTFNGLAVFLAVSQTIVGSAVVATNVGNGAANTVASVQIVGSQVGIAQLPTNVSLNGYSFERFTPNTVVITGSTFATGRSVGISPSLSYNTFIQNNSFSDLWNGAIGLTPTTWGVGPHTMNLVIDNNSFVYSDLPVGASEKYGYIGLYSAPTFSSPGVLSTFSTTPQSSLGMFNITISNNRIVYYDDNSNGLNVPYESQPNNVWGNPISIAGATNVTIVNNSISLLPGQQTNYGVYLSGCDSVRLFNNCITGAAGSGYYTGNSTNVSTVYSSCSPTSGFAVRQPLVYFPLESNFSSTVGPTTTLSQSLPQCYAFNNTVLPGGQTGTALAINSNCSTLSSYVSASYEVGSNYSYSFWMSLTQTSWSYPGLFTSQASGKNYLCVVTNPTAQTTVLCWFTLVNGTQIDNISFNLQYPYRWNHYGITFDGYTLSVYLNGVLAQSATDPSGTWFTLVPSNSVSFFKGTTGLNWHLRYWQLTLTSQEIATLYAGESTYALSSSSSSTGS